MILPRRRNCFRRKFGLRTTGEGKAWTAGGIPGQAAAMILPRRRNCFRRKFGLRTTGEGKAWTAGGIPGQAAAGGTAAGGFPTVAKEKILGSLRQTEIAAESVAGIAA